MVKAMECSKEIRGYVLDLTHISYLALCKACSFSLLQLLVYNIEVISFPFIIYLFK